MDYKFTTLQKKHLPLITRSLINKNPYYVFRRYLNIKKIDYAKYIVDKICKDYTHNPDNEIIVAEFQREITGFIGVEALKWDSSFFNIPMAKIEHFWIDDGRNDARNVRELLFSEALRICKLKGIRHLSLRVDIEDNKTIQTLQDKGFRLMTSEMIGLTDRKALLFHEDGKELSFKVRGFKAKDMTQVMGIAKHISKSVLSHYGFDLHLPQDKMENYYVENTKNCCLHKNADGMFVAEKNQEIIGFYAYKEVELFEKAFNKKACFAVLSGISMNERKKGLGISFHRAAHKNLLNDYDFIMGRTYFHNPIMLNLLTKIGNVHLTSQYCFHKYISYNV